MCPSLLVYPLEAQAFPFRKGLELGAIWKEGTKRPELKLGLYSKHTGFTRTVYLFGGGIEGGTDGDYEKEGCNSPQPLLGTKTCMMMVYMIS